MTSAGGTGVAFSRTTFVVALLSFVLTGGAWALAMPAFSGPDEPAHVYRALAVTSGELRGPSIDRVETRPDGSVFRDPATQVEVPAEFRDLAAEAACFAFRPEISVACQDPVADDREPVAVRTQFGRYPPLYYALVGWPGHVFSATPAVHAMRLLSVLLCAVPFSLAAGLLTGRPLRLLALGLAATPTLVFLAGTVNPSGPEIALAVLLWVLADRVVRTGRHAPSGVVVATAATATLLAAMRPVSPAFVVAIAVVGMLRHGSVSVARDLWARVDVRAATAVVVVGVALSIGWLLWADPFGALIGTSIPGLTLTQAAAQSLARTPRRVVEMIGVFGWLDTNAHGAVYVVWVGLSAALVTAAGVLGRWRDRLALGLILLGVLLMPVVSEALQAPDLGFVWQGRYTLPLAVGVWLVAAQVVDERAQHLRGASRAEAVAALLWVPLAVAHLLAFAAAMRRHLDGLPAPLFGWVDGAEAMPFLPAPLALVLAAAGLALATAGILAARRGVAARTGV